jgi:hypothetical protein
MEKQQLTDIIRSKESLNMTEQEYREYPAINYSTLSSLDRDPLSVNQEIKETDSMILGSLVDNLLTRGEYGEQYVVQKTQKPSGQMGDYCEYLLNGMSEEDAYNTVGFKRDNLDKVKQKFAEGDGMKYVKEVIDNAGKTVVSFDIISKASQIANALKENEFTSRFFVPGQMSPDIEVKYQVPIVFDLPNNLGKGKALFDIMLIDHATETILPVDLKTTSGTAMQFKSAFMKWKYYLQASLYYYGLKSISSYAVVPFQFLVVSTNNPKNPLIWNCTEKDLYIGRNGGKSPSGFEIKGWEQLATELNWHYHNDIWEYDFEAYKNNAQMSIDSFNDW